MPELWIPYGAVENLVTLQAENLGVVAEPPVDQGSIEIEHFSELAKGATQIFLCDSAPSTFEFLRGLLPVLGESQGASLVAPAPKRVEASVPEVKGRVITLPPPVPSAAGMDAVYAPRLIEKGLKLVVASVRPDPLFGIADARVQACLNWVANSNAIAAGAREGMEPQPFQKTGAFDAMERIASKIPDSKFLSLSSRGGKLWTIMEDAPFDAIKNSFPKVQMPQTKGLVVGAGGRGYDDTFSGALRAVWSALDGVKRTGSVLLMAECSEGVGSTALEMLVTGQMSGADRRREKYVEGLEEVFYLNKLKEEYDVLMLSGLPETYARSKLGMTTAKGSAEAVGRMLNRVGRTGKINVVPRAPEFAVQSG
ncbi:MAG TPA: hypothetical protein VEJ19_00660 [Nitrososphaerales archaeon]|nr:hypothetical protein [Nitrososphaerales archaeon]